MTDHPEQLILALETSCDETSAAVVENGTRIRSNLISSQVETHAQFGGVVPEIASRKHLQNALWVIDEALEQAGVAKEELTAIAVTHGPGLVGALLVGVSIAKALSYGLGIPLVPVHHLSGHMYANLLEEGSLRFPSICLVVSGGHTSLIHWRGHGQLERLGQTRDDAAGEAFDKVARLLDLGYPGGPQIEKLAQEGNSEAIAFPRAWLEPGSLDFSFSGLKSAVINTLHNAKQKNIPLDPADVAASFQEAVIDVLVEKTLRAALLKRVDTVYMAGGVAANRTLKDRLNRRLGGEEIQFHAPGPILCTDNAAMIGAAGYFALQAGQRADLDLNATASLPLESLRG